MTKAITIRSCKVKYRYKCAVRSNFLLRTNRRNQTGFTLIEILIVAALIALLAGIAAINIQRAYVDNQRKATYGEVDQISKALSFAFFDFGIYPKLCFLNQNQFFIAPPDPANPNRPGPYLVSGFEYLGFDINRTPALANRVISNWAQGLGSPGYFSAGGGRRGLFQGRRGGMVKVEIDIAGFNPQVLPSGYTLPIYDWPADPWGRPYVVYMLYQDGVDPQTGLPKVNFLDRPTRPPNFALAVVSYGPNGFPGGRSMWTGADVATYGQLALFDRMTRQYPTQSDYRMLSLSELTPAHVAVWSHVKIEGADPNNPAFFPGIIDPGSDDIVRDFY